MCGGLLHSGFPERQDARQFPDQFDSKIVTFRDKPDSADQAAEDLRDIMLASVVSSRASISSTTRLL